MELETLINEELGRFRKWFCSYLIDKADSLLENITEKHLNNFNVTKCEVGVLRFKIWVIMKVAHNPVITEICENILEKLETLQNLI